MGTSGFALLLALQILLPVLAEEGSRPRQLIVIANRTLAVENLTQTTIANIYRRKLLVDDRGNAFVPVNLPATNPLRRVFSTALLKQSPRELETYWNEQYYQGISPPYVVASSEAVIRFVATTAGAIGYVLDCNLSDAVIVAFRVQLDFSTDQIAAPCD
ncbi:MAG: hypothetical protein HYX63_06370 [Gammaproteobacteria bacterium]|nr:hypothetical protein [Gammaproteobacteria bacterium]